MKGGLQMSEFELQHAILRLAGDKPGHFGRLRTARIVGGYDLNRSVESELNEYAVMTDWTLTPLIDLIDGMVKSGLIIQTPGARPTLVLTRKGHRALDGMEKEERV